MNLYQTKSSYYYIFFGIYNKSFSKKKKTTTTATVLCRHHRRLPVHSTVLNVSLKMVLLGLPHYTTYAIIHYISFFFQVRVVIRRFENMHKINKYIYM